MRQPPRFLAITGPTASGKTDLSLALAARIPVEVVSMDSRQVYIGMDIGTDKADDEARRHVPHHGLDLVTPDQRYSAGHFARYARRAVEAIHARGNVPLLVGGTGFFLRAVMDPIFAEPPLDERRLARVRAFLREQSVERLAAWVERLDPDRATLAAAGGRQRMSRAIEVALLSGVPLSRWHREAPPEAAGLPGVVVVLDLPRDEMDRRIDERVGRMVERGLVDEVRDLLAAGYGVDDPGMSGTGYREIAAHLSGEATLEEAMDDIRRGTRRYSRRQLTWFRNQLPAGTLRLDATQPVEAQRDAALEAWTDGGGRSVERVRPAAGEAGSEARSGDEARR